MRNSIAHGKSVAWRTVALQLAASVVAALLAAGFGWRDGLATLVGGFLVSFGNGLFALRMYAVEHLLLLRRRQDGVGRH